MDNSATYEEIMVTSGIKDRIRALKKSGTLSEEKLPLGMEAITCKWRQKHGLDMQGQVARYEGRRLASVYVQKDSVDYHEMFVTCVLFDVLCITIGKFVPLAFRVHQTDFCSRLFE